MPSRWRPSGTATPRTRPRRERGTRSAFCRTPWTTWRGRYRPASRISPSIQPRVRGGVQAPAEPAQGKCRQVAGGERPGGQAPRRVAEAGPPVPDVEIRPREVEIEVPVALAAQRVDGAGGRVV